MNIINPRISQVKPLPNYQLALVFTSNEQGVFDVKPYLSKGVFAELRDKNLFDRVHVFNGTVVWPNELDFDPDTLYLESVKVSELV